MPSKQVYKISYWPIWLDQPGWEERHFYVRMTNFNFVGFLNFLRLNWSDGYDFTYHLVDIERRSNA